MVSSRGAWRYCLEQRELFCMMCVVISFVLPFSQLQGVEWDWPGRREPDDEHSPAFAFSSSLFLLVVVILLL